jgi:hypothetical protein
MREKGFIRFAGLVCGNSAVLPGREIMLAIVWWRGVLMGTAKHDDVGYDPRCLVHSELHDYELIIWRTECGGGGTAAKRNT